MKRFRRVLFGGYRKEDVEEYIDSMLMQLEEAKQAAKEFEETAKRAEKEREEAENQAAAGTGKEAEQAAYINRLEDKLGEYERKYQAYTEVVVEAKAQAQTYQIKAEQELLKEKEAQEKELKEARQKLDEYADQINRLRQQLEMAYQQLGSLLKTLPIRIEDVLGEDTVNVEDECLGKKAAGTLKVI